MLLAQRECGWLQQRHRQSCVGTPASGKQNAEAVIGMTVDKRLADALADTAL
jgi:hypothetical protein